MGQYRKHLAYIQYIQRNITKARQYQRLCVEEEEGAEEKDLFFSFFSL